MGVLSITQGDAFETPAEHELFEEMCKEGNSEVLASDAWDGGWGHHGVHAVILFKDKFYRLDSGGCSCDGSGTITGPFDTADEAGIADDGMSDGDFVRDN